MERLVLIKHHANINLLIRVQVTLILAYALLVNLQVLEFQGFF
jgi:hypothetical protein